MTCPSCGLLAGDKADVCTKCGYPILLARIAGVMRNQSQRKDSDEAFRLEMQRMVDDASRRSLKDFDPLRTKVAAEAQERERKLLDHERALAKIAMDSAVALRWDYPCPHCGRRGAVASKLTGSKGIFGKPKIQLACGHCGMTWAESIPS